MRSRTGEEEEEEVEEVRVIPSPLLLLLLQSEQQPLRLLLPFLSGERRSFEATFLPNVRKLKKTCLKTRESRVTQIRRTLSKTLLCFFILKCTHILQFFFFVPFLICNAKQLKRAAEPLSRAHSTTERTGVS